MKGPIIGRQVELDLIESLFDAASGGPRAVVLEGAAGIGKSMVLAEALRRARGRGITVLDALPSGGEVELAYAGVSDMLASVRETIDALPPPQRRALRAALLLEEPGQSAPDERAVAAALLGLLSALSRDSVVVVAVDDLQWLDMASARALAFALRRLRKERVVFLATLREGEAEAASRRGLDDVAGDRIDRHTLGPLTVASIFTLIESRLGTALPRPTVVRVHEVAGGNPLFALELARALIERGATLSPGDPIPVPTELRDLFLHRLGRLSAAASSALAAAAALARPTVTLVCAAEGVSAADALDEAAEVGAIHYEGDRIRFAHPLIASIHYESVSPVRRRELHKRLAAVVPDGEERVHHLARSVVVADRRIASELDRASQSARSRGASEAAAALAEQALTLTPPSDRVLVHARRLEAAGHYFAAGDSARARELLESAIADAADGAQRAAALGALARVELGAEDVAKALEHFGAAVAEDGLDNRLRASLLEGMAHAAAIRQSLDAAVAYAREAVACAGREDEALRAQCLGMLARCEHHRGRDRTRGVLEEAVELERRGGTLAFDASPSGVYAQTLLEAGDVDGARSVLVDLCERARDAGDSSLSRPLSELSRLELGAGNLDRAEALARESYEVAVQAGRKLAQAPGLVQLGHVMLARGNTDEARVLAARALELTQRTGRASRDPNALLGAVELAAGRYEEACTYLSRCNEKHAELGSWIPTKAMVHGIEVFSALSRLDDAQTLLEPIVEYAERFDRPHDHAVADYCRGLIAAGAGELELAAVCFERSLAVGAPQPIVEGQKLIQLGIVERRLRRKADARRTLIAALALLEPAGAELWAAKAREELSRIGGRAAAREGLSATEQRIVDLVAAGRTTREVAEELFVSAKTVEWNLTRIYRKLGVRSRTELAARGGE
jgi:DNA-binding CsgD family transcriptional regulator/predicted ATPase